MTAAVRTTTPMVDGAVYHTERHASVILFCNNQHGRPRRREQNLIVCSRKSEAELVLDILYY